MFTRSLEIVFISLSCLFFASILISFFYISQKKRKLLKARNLFYPIELLRMAQKNSSLQQYIASITDECAGRIFGQGWKSYERYSSLDAQEIEKISIHNSRKIPKNYDWKEISCVSLDGWYPFSTFYLFRQYLQKKLSQEGKSCVQKILKDYKGNAYKALFSQGEGSHKELSLVYTDNFFDSISSLEDLEKYPKALDFLIESYAQKQTSLSGLQLLGRFMDQNNLKIYELLVNRCAQKDPKELMRIYKDEFFSRITTLKQLQTFPQAFSFLLQSYIQNTAGICARTLVDKLLKQNSKELYEKMFSHLYNNKDKEFALQMIQEYPYLPGNVKIGILSCKQGNRYVDASIQKLKELEKEDTVCYQEDEWTLLFRGISKLLGSEIKIPKNLIELKKTKKLLEFHRDNANSSGDMLKVLDIEKILETLEKAEKKFANNG